MPHDFTDCFACIETSLRRTKELIARQFVSLEPEVLAHFQQTCFLEGKMLRPALVLLTGGMCDSITDDHIRAGALLEIIHYASLIHDDVLDVGQIRRGRPTAYALFGNKRSILLGDVCVSLAFRMMRESWGP